MGTKLAIVHMHDIGKTHNNNNKKVIIMTCSFVPSRRVSTPAGTLMFLMYKFSNIQGLNGWSIDGLNGWGIHTCSSSSYCV